MTFGCWPHDQAQRILQGGRWWLPPSLGHGEYYESVFACGSFVHQKCSTYALTNLLFGLCRLMWVIDLLVNLSNPHLGTPTHPSYPWNVVNQGTHPNSFSFHCLHFWTYSWVHQGAWGCVNKICTSWHTSSKKENKTLHHNLTIVHIMYKVDISNMITQVLLNKNKKQWYEIMKK